MIERLETAAQRSVSRETFDRLHQYATLLTDENRRQNLVSSGTIDALWERHVIDSAQLVRLEPKAGASWADVGSGAGLPGLVIALLVEGPVLLIEPRRLRAEFLMSTVQALGLAGRVRVEATKVERLQGHYDVITARAVAPLDRLLVMAVHLSTGKTVWALPKGRSAERELAEARRSWQAVFHVERSVTDDDARIIVATGVRVKKR